MRQFTLAILLGMLCLSGVARPSCSIYELRCHQERPEQPRFSWKIAAQERNFEQQAYQILVSDNAAFQDQVWDSKKVTSDQSIWIDYRGTALQPATQYYCKVRVWDAKKQVSPWSATTTFTTALFDSTHWGRAEWIGLQADDPEQSLVPGVHKPLVQQAIGDRQVGMYRLPLLRRAFVVEKPIKQAMAYISGLGHFDLFLNGKKVGENFLDPGWSLYSKSALYVAFDMTQALQKNNVLGVMLGNGFYNIPRERYFKQLVSFGAPKVKMVLKIHYTDGTTQEVVSDGQWRATNSPITYSSIYGGEDYDARQELAGWNETGFDQNQWSPVVQSNPQITLRPQQSASLHVRQAIPVVRHYLNAKGERIYDLGQNFSGIIRVHLRGERGSVVRFVPGELLNPDSTINQSASGSPFSFQYTLSGNPKGESWQPQFTYYGFRYVAVDNPNVTIESIEGLHTTTSSPEVGTFRCSNPMFNQTYELIDWAVRSNLASIITDCPHREKLGWLEVAHLMQYAMQYRYDLSGLYAKLMEDMRDSQTAEGIVPTIAPEYVRFEGGFEDTPEWGSAMVAVPWNIYQWYGDKSLIEQYFPQMERYVAYLQSRAKNHIVAYGLGDWYDLGPKAPGYAQLTSNGVTATAFYYYNTTLLAKMALLLGQSEKATAYQAQAQLIRQAFNKTYYNPAGYYDRNSQTANAIALYMGLVEPENKTQVYQSLVADIAGRNYALTAGDVGYLFVLRALEQNGGSAIIYKMNAKYDTPGYGWQLAHGATALTESWQAYGSVSNNHCMLGHLMEWLFCGVGGVGQEPGSVGFKTQRIAPAWIEGIGSASTQFESPYGRITCDWKEYKKHYSVLVTVPANSQAIVHLPTQDPKQITESGVALPQATDCQIEATDNQGIQVRIGSGTYRFEVQKGLAYLKLNR